MPSSSPPPPASPVLPLVWAPHPTVAEHWLLTLYIKVHPKSRLESLAPAAAGLPYALVVHVREVPEDNKANVAVVANVAQVLGLPKSQVVLSKGAGQRFKTLLVSVPKALAPTVSAQLAAWGFGAFVQA